MKEVSIRVQPDDIISRLQQLCIKNIEEGYYIHFDKPKHSLSFDEWLDKWSNEYEYEFHAIYNSFEFELFEPTEEEIEYYDFQFRRSFFKHIKKHKNLTAEDKQDAIATYRKGMFDDTGEIIFIDDVDKDNKFTIPEGEILNWTIEKDFDKAEQIFREYLSFPETYDNLDVMVHRLTGIPNPELEKQYMFEREFSNKNRKPSKWTKQVLANIERLEKSEVASQKAFLIQHKDRLDFMRRNLNKVEIDGVKFNPRIYYHINNMYASVREKAIKQGKSYSIDFVFWYYINHPELFCPLPKWEKE